MIGAQRVTETRFGPCPSINMFSSDASLAHCGRHPAVTPRATALPGQAYDFCWSRYRIVAVTLAVLVGSLSDATVTVTVAAADAPVEVQPVRRVFPFELAARPQTRVKQRVVQLTIVGNRAHHLRSVRLHEVDHVHVFRGASMTHAWQLYPQAGPSPRRRPHVPHRRRLHVAAA
jgi:hypothetical protein